MDTGSEAKCSGTFVLFYDSSFIQDSLADRTDDEGPELLPFLT